MPQNGLTCTNQIVTYQYIQNDTKVPFLARQITGHKEVDDGAHIQPGLTKSQRSTKKNIMNPLVLVAEFSLASMNMGSSFTICKT